MEIHSNPDVDTRRIFDAIILVPLEEEFEIVLDQFDFVENLTNGDTIRFAVSLPGCSETFLLVKQSSMGRTGNAEATRSSLTDFDATILICIGIAAGLSSDVHIGDVCHTGSIVDVLDNAKITDLPNGGQRIMFSPTFYNTPSELATPIALNRINPTTKPSHLAWAAERGDAGRTLIPCGFTGRSGKHESIKDPKVWQGLIACGLVSGSPEYNKQLKAIDRKILALETESGALFSVAQARRLPAITIRGISDFGGDGIDKNKFEEETGNNARRLAVSNAATFLSHQLQSPPVHDYFTKHRCSSLGSGSAFSSSNLGPLNQLQDTLLMLDEEYNAKLRSNSPAYTLVPKGYRFPMPRIRVNHPSPDDNPRAARILDIQDAFNFCRVATIHIPREYPDRSLSWIIALTLLTLQLHDKQLCPYVIEARHMQVPRTGIDRLTPSDVLALEHLPEAQLVFIIDEFDFGSKSRSDFLRDQINNRPKAWFLIVSRSAADIVKSSDFTKATAAHITELAPVAFSEISHFVQKNYEMEMSEAEVIALRLRETFERHSLSAHPSYFAGISRDILNSLLRANRRGELIELAIAGYLSFVVAEDKEPIALSRTTREKFLTELAFENKVNGLSFTEAELTGRAETFANKFDFKIAPARFISSFLQRTILHNEDGKIAFTLPFMEHYMLAKCLTEQPSKAMLYFALDSDIFDYPTFGLYSELGAAPKVLSKVRQKLDQMISELSTSQPAHSIILGNELRPAFFRRKQSTTSSFQRALQKAEEDVRLERDTRDEKQKFLDVTDQVRDEIVAGIAQARQLQESTGVKQYTSIESDAGRIWSAAVILLGSGAERLEAQDKRELIERIVILATLIAESWTYAQSLIDFNHIREEIQKQYENLSEEFRSNVPELNNTTTPDLLNILTDMSELILLMQPLTSMLSFLCDEAGDAVLAKSLANTSVQGKVETLIRDLWLSDISPAAGKRALTRCVRELPKSLFIRHAVSMLLMARVYWKQWDKEGRLILLRIANDSLKGVGARHDQTILQNLLKTPISNDGLD